MSVPDNIIYNSREDIMSLSNIDYVKLYKYCSIDVYFTLPDELINTNAAAFYGRLDLLNILYNEPCKSNETIGIHAIHGNQLDVINFIHNNNGVLTKHMLDNAAYHGYLDIIIYLVEICNIIPDIDTLNTSIKPTNIPTIEYLLMRDIIPNNTTIELLCLCSDPIVVGGAMIIAITNGNIVSLTPTCVRNIIRSDSMELLRFITNRPFNITIKCFNEAVYMGKLDMVTYLYDSFEEIRLTAPVNNGLVREAIKYEYIELAHYLIHRSFHINGDTLTAAIYINNLDLVKSISTRIGVTQFHKDKAWNLGFNDIASYLDTK